MKSIKGCKYKLTDLKAILNIGLLWICLNQISKNYSFQHKITQLLPGEDRGELSYSFPNHNTQEENSHLFFEASKHQLDTAINSCFYYHIQRLMRDFNLLIKQKIFRLEIEKPPLDFISHLGIHA